MTNGSAVPEFHLNVLYENLKQPLILDLKLSHA